MGFIFAGRAYKRPQYVVPAQKQKQKQIQKPINPQLQQKTPQISNYAIPQPARSMMKRLGSANSVNPAKKVKRDEKFNENPSNVIAKTKIQPKTLGLGLSVCTAGSLLLEPSRLPTFLDLPTEILYHIYCFAGVGKVNRLAQTCVELHTLFDFSKNDYFLTLLIHSNMLIDLSKGTSGRNWPLRLTGKYQSLPERFRISPVMESAFHRPINAARITWAVDSSIFTYPGIDERHVRLVKSRFGGIVVDFTSATRQRKRKRRYLEWRYMVFKKFVALALQDPEAPAKVLLDEAETLVPCKEYKRTHKLDGFEPLLISGAVPLHMYCRVDLQKIRVISELRQQYGMPISCPAVLVNSVFSNHTEFPESMLDLLFHLDFERSATESDVLETLRTFDEFRYKILDVPAELRETSELLHAVVRYYEFLKDVLTFHYEAHPQNDSSMIWEALKEIQIPELLDHVVGLGVAVPLDIF